MMHNTGAQGSLRGYVPQQRTNQGVPYAMPQQSRNNQTAPFETINGQRGFASGASAPLPKKKHGGGWKIFAVILALMLIGGAAYAGIIISRDVAEKQRISEKVTPYNSLYCPGVYVDGIPLGGMTPEQALNSVQSQINQRNDAWKVQLVYDGNIVADITTDTLNMNVDQNAIYELLNEAWTHGHTGTEAERYAQMEALEQEPYRVYTARPSGDTGEITRLLNELKNRIDQPVQDASLAGFNPDLAYPFIFNREVIGRILNIEPIIQQLYQMVSTMESGTVELKPEEILPTVYQAELEKHYALRAFATTPIHHSSPENRNKNIQLAFSKFNGYTLKPGKTFSFNNVVGERSLKNGFLEAIEYAYDEHIVGVGGGVCQASTTLYQAAVCAGLQIVQRKPHSDEVTYTEYGKDATVYWYKGGKKIDLSFKNNTDGNIYICAQVLDDPTNKNRQICKVRIYGEDLGNVEYKLTTEIIETLPSALLEPVYVSEKDKAAKAKDGYVVKSYRVTYINGVQTEMKELDEDTYKPKPEKIYDPSRAKN